MNFFRFKLIYIEYFFSYVIEVWTCTEVVFLGTCIYVEFNRPVRLCRLCLFYS